MNPASRTSRAGAARHAAVVVFALGVAAGVFAQQPVPPSQLPTAAQPAASAPPAKVAQARVEAKPTWQELTPSQQQALAPLTGTWGRLGAAHKRKWLAVSQNFPTMPPGEQARLHTRMDEWAALSPQQRAQARQNYFQTQALPADDRKAKWEAYQALPPEEKSKLAGAAAAARPPPPATAAAVQPVPQDKLATVPKQKKSQASAPRSASSPKIDQNTLLPQPAALPAQP